MKNGVAIWGSSAPTQGRRIILRDFKPPTNVTQGSGGKVLKFRSLRITHPTYAMSSSPPMVDLGDKANSVASKQYNQAADSECDICTLGYLMYELLTGEGTVPSV